MMFFDEAFHIFYKVLRKPALMLLVRFSKIMLIFCTAGKYFIFLSFSEETTKSIHILFELLIYPLVFFRVSH